MFFPLRSSDLIKKENRGDFALALQVLSPYDHEKLAQSILDKIKKGHSCYSHADF
jgi:hypothetical protein